MFSVQDAYNLAMPAPNESNERCSQNEGIAHGSTQAQAILPPAPPAGSFGKEKDQDKKGFCEKYKHEIEFFGIVLVLVYCLANLGELWVFNDERKTMQNEFNAAQTNTINQLAVMQAQLNETWNDDRSWLFVAGVKEIKSADNATRTFQVAFKNFGKSPAFNFRSDIKASDTNQIDDDELMPETTAGTIPPSQEQFVEFPGVPSKYLEPLNNGRASVYVWGTFWYDDFSGHHSNQFCFKADRDPIETNLLVFRPTPFHNNGDAPQH